jgi:hypothetical protein
MIIGYLPKSHTKFIDIEKQFIDKWTHTNLSIPSVQDILTIFPSATHRQQYTAYCSQLEATGNFKAKATNFSFIFYLF